MAGVTNNLTNFALLTNEQKTVWSMDLWEQARNLSFINQFLGKDSNSVVQHVTELTKTQKGARAVITLVHDLEGDGVAGDRMLEGNEESGRSSEQVIQIDQLRNAERGEGRMADQKSIVNFREQARDKLAYWLSDRIDQMALLTMSGQPYTLRNAGYNRVGSDLASLEFAPTTLDAPTAKRYARWDHTNGLQWGSGTSTITTADIPEWELFVALKAYAKDNYIRGVREKGGEEAFHAFLSPQAMAKLKLSATYMQNLRYAMERGDSNNLFAGGTVKIDGIYFHEHRHVVNTRLASGAALVGGGGPLHSKWGSSGDIDGCQILFCGAQALGMADLGAPEWNEKAFDFGNQQAISTGKILGFKKPKFYSQYSGGTIEDFGVLSVYVCQQ